MKYNVIGDIHGRTSWKELVIEDGINIFVGYYFSPYHRGYTFEKCMQNFREIIEFKKQRPETILLIGNHDADHWQWNNDRYQCSRHDFEHDLEIAQEFEKNKDLFQIAYSAGNQYLISHAGVSMVWYYRNKVLAGQDKINRFSIVDQFIDLTYPKSLEFSTAMEAYIENEEFKQKHSSGHYKAKYEFKDNMLLLWKDGWYISKDNEWNKIETETPDSIAEFVNKLWKELDIEFKFDRNAMHGDYCGESITHSPVWIRPTELNDANIFRGTNFKQVVGHTMFRNITEENNLVFVDCLEYNTESFTFEC